MSSHQTTPPYVLPAKYKDLSGPEQAKTLQGCILAFLDEHGRGPASVIAQGIGAPNEDTVRKQLKAIAATQQVYLDYIGGTPVYFRNGRLSHHTLQKHITCGRAEYAFRTYSDRHTGRHVTITEFGVSPLGRTRAKSGIRVDLEYLDDIIAALTEIRDRVREDPTLLENNIRSAAT